MRGLGLGGPAGLRLHRLARFEQPPLGMIQAVIGASLFLFDAQDRRLRLFLTRLLGTKLLFRGPPLDGDLFLLAIEAIRRLDRSSRLQLEGDDVLLLVMERFLEGSTSRRSRRSLISRLVARMPRASARVPPSTWWGPR